MTEYVGHGQGAGSSDVDGTHQETVLSIGERQARRMDDTL